MIGMIGILGCVSGATCAIAVCAIVSAAVSIVSLGYGISSSLESADRMDQMNADNEERSNVQKALADRANRESLVKAAQMAATGSLMDRIMTQRAESKATKLRRQSHGVDSQHGAVPRGEYNRGTVTQGTTIKM